MLSLQRSEVTGAHNEDCEIGDREEKISDGKSGRDAIWVYAGKRNNKCSLYIMKNA